jgi:hypothetical protein
MESQAPLNDHVVRAILSPPKIVKLSVQSTSFVQGTLTFNNLRASAAAAPAVLKVVVGCRVGCITALQRFTIEVRHNFLPR